MITSGVYSRTSNVVKQAGLCIFSGLSILFDSIGAVVMSQLFQFWALHTVISVADKPSILLCIVLAYGFSVYEVVEI
jgi:hypothetical protein